MICLRNGVKLGFKPDLNSNDSNINWCRRDNPSLNSSKEFIDECLDIFKSLNDSSFDGNIRKSSIENSCKMYLQIYQQREISSIETQLLFLYYYTKLLVNGDENENLSKAVRTYIHIIVKFNLEDANMNDLDVLIILGEEKDFKAAYKKNKGTSFVADKLFKINSLVLKSQRNLIEKWQIDIYNVLERNDVTTFDKKFIRFLLEGKYEHHDFLVQSLVRQYFMSKITVKTLKSLDLKDDPREIIFQAKPKNLVDSILRKTNNNYLFCFCFINMVYLTNDEVDKDDFMKYFSILNSICDQLPEKNAYVSYLYWSFSNLSELKFGSKSKEIKDLKENIYRIIEYHYESQKLYLEPEQSSNPAFKKFWDEIKNTIKPYFCSTLQNDEDMLNVHSFYLSSLLNQQFLSLSFQQRLRLIKNLKKNLLEPSFNYKELNGDIIISLLECALNDNELNDLINIFEEWRFDYIDEYCHIPEYHVE